MFVTYPYRNYLSRYAAGFVDTERRDGPESLATVPISVARPGRGAGGRRAAGPALGTSRMQFTNTSDATLQTDTNQHNAGGELHATLLNNEPYQHTRPHPMGGPPRCRSALQGLAAGPGGPDGARNTSDATTNQAKGSRVAISRAGRRPPAHTAAQPNRTSHAAAGPGWASRRHAEAIISTPGSTCVEGAGGTGGHGRASRRGAEQSEVA